MLITVVHALSQKMREIQAESHKRCESSQGWSRQGYLHRMQTVYELEMENCQEMIDYGSGHEIAAATRQKEKLVKQLKDCWEYDALEVHIAISRINTELDEGVKVKCRKAQTGADERFVSVKAETPRSQPFFATPHSAGAFIGSRDFTCSSLMMK